MPIAVHPLPRRIRRTHENLPLGVPTSLLVPPGTAESVTEALRESLELLFPGISAEDDAEPEALTVRFTRFEDAPEEIPAAVADQAYRLSVGPDGIEVQAGSTAGWRWATRQLAGLREGTALRGIELLDWPSFRVRRLELEWPATSVSAAAYAALFELLTLGRVNELGLSGSVADLPDEVREKAARSGIEIVASGGESSFRVVEDASLFPRYSERLPALLEAALAAEADGRSGFVVALGASDAQTALESLAFGLLFAGDCAWNPRKTDLKTFRRTYAMRRFGLDSRAPLLVIDTLEEGAALLGAEDALDPGDPFAVNNESPPRSSPLPLRDLRTSVPSVSLRPASAPGAMRPDEQAAALEQKGAAAMTAMGPLQPDSEERAAALQGLQWAAQRLKRIGSLLGTAERVRELYRAAYVASASPKALSDRLLRAVDLLESEARAWDDHRGEWHALWRREREGPYDPETEAALRQPGEALLARAARLKDLRSVYIQTGSLPSPAKEGLERTAARLTTGLVPGRLPPQPSPAWWPEGGAARVQMEVECPPAAADIPWAVQADFRALAGETGAFNVRSVRLVPITESDEAGPEQPCQLTRGGFAFIPPVGQSSYFLYLDPDPIGDSGFREVRAGQSRRAVRLENRRLRLSLSPVSGFISGWQLINSERELLPAEAESDDARAAWRLRVIETGPLLARVRCEHPDGRARQFDLGAGQPWIDVSMDSPGEELALPLREGVWSGEVEQTGDGEENRAGAVSWAELHDATGLTVGVVLPERPAPVTLHRDGLQVHSPPSGHCLLLAEVTEKPDQTLSRLAEAWQQPPRVRLGIFEHRRVREF
jgi:hypothetical protein